MKKIFTFLAVISVATVTILAVRGQEKLNDCMIANVDALARTEAIKLSSCWLKRTGLGYAQTGIYCVSGTSASLAYPCPTPDTFVRGDSFSCVVK